MKKKFDYYRYIKSPEWKRKKEAFIAHLGVESCFLCQAETKCNLHHRTYRRLGRDKFKDLKLLCHGCHEFMHTIEKIGRMKPSRLDAKLSTRWSDYCGYNRLWSRRIKKLGAKALHEEAIQFFRTDDLCQSAIKSLRKKSQLVQIPSLFFIAEPDDDPEISKEAYQKALEGRFVFVKESGL